MIYASERTRTIRPPRIALPTVWSDGEGETLTSRTIPTPDQSQKRFESPDCWQIRTSECIVQV
jgi:hypothetical protein